MTKIAIRRCQKREVEALFGLIRELAIHQGDVANFELTPEALKKALFGRQGRRVKCLVAVAGREIIGLALWFYSWTSLRGDWIIYLEDLFVLPEYRNRGICTQLLAHVSKDAVREKFPRVTWHTVQSNKKAIHFYTALAAVKNTGSCQFALSGSALSALAEQAS